MESRCFPIPDNLYFATQVSVLWACGGALLSKKVFQERAQRPWIDFALDVSKQLVGACWVGLWSREVAGCAEHLAGVLASTTVGVLMQFVLFSVVSRMFEQHAQNGRYFRTGEYYTPGGLFVPGAYAIQLLIWLVCITAVWCLSPLVMPPFVMVSRVLLMFFVWFPSAELLLVTLVAPCGMYAFQAWVTDDFLKKEGAPGFFWSLVQANFPQNIVDVLEDALVSPEQIQIFPGALLATAPSAEAPPAGCGQGLGPREPDIEQPGPPQPEASSKPCGPQAPSAGYEPPVLPAGTSAPHLEVDMAMPSLPGACDGNKEKAPEATNDQKIAQAAQEAPTGVIAAAASATALEAVAPSADVVDAPAPADGVAAVGASPEVLEAVALPTDAAEAGTPTEGVAAAAAEATTFEAIAPSMDGAIEAKMPKLPLASGSPLSPGSACDTTPTCSPLDGASPVSPQTLKALLKQREEELDHWRQQLQKVMSNEDEAKKNLREALTFTQVVAEEGEAYQRLTNAMKGISAAAESA